MQGEFFASFRFFVMKRKAVFSFVVSLLCCIFATLNLYQMGNNLRKLFSPYVWGNLYGMLLVVVMLCIGVKYVIDIYTHHGESIVVPDFVHKQLDDAEDIADKVGLTIEVSDTGYVKELPPDCILEQSPVGGKRVKSTHVIYVTINAATVPSIPLPDLIDNSSLREAEAQLLSMGFKVGDPEYRPGEKDWVYGITVNGRPVHTGDRIPKDATLVIQVGDGTRDYADTTLIDQEEYEGLDVPEDEGDKSEEDEYEYEYRWEKVPADEDVPDAIDERPLPDATEPETSTDPVSDNK